MKMFVKLKIWCLLAVFVVIDCQEKNYTPIYLSPGSFGQISRSFIPVPEGRSAKINDTRIIFYSGGVEDQTTYTFGNIRSLLNHPNFDTNKPTALYVHGYPASNGNVKLFNTRTIAAIAIAIDEEESTASRNGRKNVRKWGVHPIWRKRRYEGEFFTLCRDLPDDEDKFFGYFRMSKDNFQILLHKLSAALKRQQTRFQSPITPEERLAVCISYAELVSDESVVHVVSSYLKRGDHNVLALDWSNLAFGSYLNVVLDTPLVGEETGKALLRLVDKGFNIKSLHVVGHSAGVPVAAVVARSLKRNGHTLSRVTGLDPATDGFLLPLSTASLNSRDALFVDIIHTDAGKYGSAFSLGHVDFWPNGGQAIQPGCPRRYIPLISIESFCSHWRSWRFYAESLVGGKFVARKSTDYDAFLRGYGSETALMGISATPDLRGNFYLQTATREPFALGDRGALLR